MLRFNSYILARKRQNETSSPLLKGRAYTGKGFSMKHRNIASRTLHHDVVGPAVLSRRGLSVFA